MTEPECDLDHPRLDTVVKLCAPDETDPRWEIAACDRRGDLLTYQGMSGTRLIAMLSDLLTETAIVKVSLTLWVPR